MAARAMWKGVLALPGLRVPVKLYSAVEDRKVHFHLLQQRAEQRVEQRMVNPESGDVVETAEIRRGYEAEPGVFVVLEPEELAKLEPEPSRDVKLESFLPAGTIDQAYYERPYWLGPDGDEEGYFALVAALRDAEREGLARWAMRKRPYAGALRAEGGHLALIALRHAGEVVLASDVPAPGGRDLDAREKKLAEQLVEALAADFEPEIYRDTYRERVEELIAAKAKGKRLKLAKVETREETTSLEKALQASLRKTGGTEPGSGKSAAAAKKSSATTAEPAAARAKSKADKPAASRTKTKSPKPARKAAAKKTTRKTAAKAAPRRGAAGTRKSTPRSR
jgi:DNA end-binding protein Ku